MFEHCVRKQRGGALQRQMQDLMIEMEVEKRDKTDCDYITTRKALLAERGGVWEHPARAGITTEKGQRPERSVLAPLVICNTECMQDSNCGAAPRELRRKQTEATFNPPLAKLRSWGAAWGSVFPAVISSDSV